MRPRPERMTLEQVDAAAPEHPPCFQRRDDWLDYLLAAQAPESIKNPQHRPFAAKGGVITFRSDFNFCRECTSDHAEAMRERERCQPAVFQEAPCN